MGVFFGLSLSQTFILALIIVFGGVLLYHLLEGLAHVKPEQHKIDDTDDGKDG